MKTFRNFIAGAWVEPTTGAYFDNVGGACFIPPNRNELSTLLQLHLLEKAVYELGYELNNRPAWIAIPLAGISQLLAS